MSVLRTAAQFQALDQLHRSFADLPEKKHRRAVEENRRAYSNWMALRWSGDGCLAELATKIAQSAAQQENLQIALLQNLCPEIGWRTLPLAPLTPHHQPLPPLHAEAALHRLFDWTGEEAFTQLHPVEKTALCQARLLEIAPFRRHNLPLASATSCFWLLRAGYLFPMWEHEQPGKFEEYLDEAFKLEMQSLVDYLLRGENAAFRMILNR